MFLCFAAFGLFAFVMYLLLAKDEYVGLILFSLFFVANIFIAVLLSRAGDPEVEKRIEMEQGHAEHHEVHLPPPSIWPAVIAVGAAVIGWGFMLKPPVVIAGVIIIVMGAAGWAGGFRAINRDLAAWGEVWRHRQYKNIADINAELEEMERKGIEPRP
jgi:CubicO group peptidase (beta-lactamase class C family)